MGTQRGPHRVKKFISIATIASEALGTSPPPPTIIDPENTIHKSKEKETIL